MHPGLQRASFTHCCPQIPQKWRSRIIHPYEETFSARVGRKALGDSSIIVGYVLGAGTNRVWLLYGSGGVLYNFSSNPEVSKVSGLFYCRCSLSCMMHIGGPRILLYFCIICALFAVMIQYYILLGKEAVSWAFNPSLAPLPDNCASHPRNFQLSH